MKRLVPVLFLIACSSHEDAPQSPADGGTCQRTFLASRAFTADERKALGNSATRWNAIASESFCVADGTGNETHGIYRIAYRSPEWQQLSELFGGADVIGVHWGATDQIGVVDVLSPALFELVALHEMGHAHGLAHTPTPAIMAPGVGSATDFTPIDLAECKRVGACPGGNQADTFGRVVAVQVVVR